jgi:hypothetical protein
MLQIQIREFLPQKAIGTGYQYHNYKLHAFVGHGFQQIVQHHEFIAEVFKQL